MALTVKGPKEPPGRKKPRWQRRVGSSLGCYSGLRLRWLLQVFKVLCFCWIFPAKPLCAVATRIQPPWSTSHTVTMLPRSRCLQLPLRTPQSLLLRNALSYRVHPAAIIRHPTGHSHQCIIIMHKSFKVRRHQLAFAATRTTRRSRRCCRPLAWSSDCSVSSTSKRLGGCCHFVSNTQDLRLPRSWARTKQTRVLSASGPKGFLLPCGATPSAHRLQSTKESRGPTPSECVRATAGEIRSVGNSLAFWLHPEGTAASDVSIYEEQFAASINKDLEQAWAALVTDEQEAAGQSQPLVPLPLSALREDHPQLFYHPPVASDGLPVSNPDVCECQQAAPTAGIPAGGACGQCPEFFGRHLTLEGFSPAAPGASGED